MPVSPVKIDGTSALRARGEQVVFDLSGHQMKPKPLGNGGQKPTTTEEATCIPGPGSVAKEPRGKPSTVVESPTFWALTAIVGGVAGASTVHRVLTGRPRIATCRKGTGLKEAASATAPAAAEQEAATALPPERNPS